VVGPQPQTPDQEKLAQNLAALFRAARAVISDHQELINDKDKGDKGLTGEKVVELTKQNYKKATNDDLQKIDPSTHEGELMRAMLDAITQVMDKAQPLINKQGLGFKGFLPAVFGKQVADAFRASIGGKADIKLTAPKSYVRNRANMPDDWEDKVIETVFKARDFARGKAYAEMGEQRGKLAYRLMIPEYYAASCLSCHGEPKGERDITGGKKEGAKLDELGGAISVAIYAK
jgi:hypothetical protein